MILLLSDFQVDEMSNDETDAWVKLADIESNARLRNEVELFMMRSARLMPRTSQSNSSADIAASSSGSIEEKSGAAPVSGDGAEWTGAGGIEDTGFEFESCGPVMPVSLATEARPGPPLPQELELIVTAGAGGLGAQFRQRSPSTSVEDAPDVTGFEIGLMHVSVQRGGPREC